MRLRATRSAGKGKELILQSDKLPPWVLPVRRLVHSRRVKAWCGLPYPGHPKGCPNIGRDEKCPPQSPYITEVIDTTREMFLVHSEFDLQAHVNKMKAKHPDWSDRRCRCVLYWQPRSKKQLKERTARAMRLLGLPVVAMLPESLGVNVYATARASGLKLEKIKQLKTNRHVAIIGHRRPKLKRRVQ